MLKLIETFAFELDGRGEGLIVVLSFSLINFANGSTALQVLVVVRHIPLILRLKLILQVPILICKLNSLGRDDDRGSNFVLNVFCYGSLVVIVQAQIVYLGG